MKLIIAASTEANMRYASGLSIPDPFILLDTGKHKYALLSSLEYGRAKREAPKGVTPVPMDPIYKKLKRRKQRRGSLMPAIVAEFLKKRRITRVEMPGNSWIRHVMGLRKEGIKVTIAKGALYPERAIKNTAEIREINKVRAATVEALDHVLNIIKKSTPRNKFLLWKGKKLTSEFLKMEARKILLEHACEASEIIISHGIQTAFPHDMGSGPLKANEPVILDFFPRSTESGYWFDMTRTVWKGAPSEEFAKLWYTVQQAHFTALALVKPGVRTGEIHAAVEQVFKETGYKTTAEEGFIHGTGHGVGLEIHEGPSLHPEGKEVLKAGQVITIEPGLYYPRIGGARLENTVLVTTTGYRDLTRHRQVLRL